MDEYNLVNEALLNWLLESLTNEPILVDEKEIKIPFKTFLIKKGGKK